ncbi:MAG: hypothetical protein WBV81_15210 [Ignavibacteriaceae bacterium]
MNISKNKLLIIIIAVIVIAVIVVLFLSPGNQTMMNGEMNGRIN